MLFTTKGQRGGDREELYMSVEDNNLIWIYGQLLRREQNNKKAVKTVSSINKWKGKAKNELGYNWFYNMRRTTQN